MADVTVKVISPATSFALLTLEEAKLMLAIPANDTSVDAQLQFLIDTNSAVIAAKCNNRVFARETVTEWWRCVYPNRIFLTHWPLCEDDIEKVECPEGTVLDRAAYRVEEASGKISLLNGKTEPIVVTYTGGYNLPKDAPMALKQATALMVGLARAEQQRTTTAGIRMIAHKSARVQFHAESSGGTGGGGGSSGTLQAVDNLLSHFMRLWV